MSSMYAMRRANGDWFALDDHGRLRVPVFRSRSEARQAHACNWGMLLFKTVVLDEAALKNLARRMKPSRAFGVRIHPSFEPRRPIEHAQLLC